MAVAVASLATQLVSAWGHGPLVDPSDLVWGELDQASALAVGAEVLQRLGTASGPAEWKLGATDHQTQVRLGVSGPVCAPLVPTRVRRDVSSCVVARDEFRQPRLEAEIGLLLVAGAWRAVPAVEIADCRIEGWELPPWSLLADACVQGAMFFGAVAPYGNDVEVVVRHDGVERSHGRGRVDEAIARLAVLPPDAMPTAVATGSLTPLLDLVPGRWDVDFGAFGRLVLDVV